MCPFPRSKGVLSKPANVHVANMGAHQSLGLVFSFLAVSALREQTEAQGPECEGCLSWLDLGVSACVCARVHVCARICVAHHIKERWSGSVVMTSDPGMLRDRGRVEEVEGKKKTQLNMLTHTRKKGGITKCATARKTTTDRDLAICLVNFYWDLWAGASKSLYAHTLKWSHSHIHAWLHTVLKCIPSSIPLNLYEFVFHCPSLNPMRMFKTIFIWLWYEWTRSTEFLVPWMRTLSLCFFIICAWNEVFKGDLASTSFMHLFLASGGYNLNPWQNIKHWLSMCMHGVWVTGSVYVWVCFNMFFQPAVNESFTLCVTVDAHVYTCVFPLCVCVCARARASLCHSCNNLQLLAFQLFCHGPF